MNSLVEKEFETVSLLLGSSAETRAVDAFCLTWIKLERQLRRMNANLLFQATVFDASSKEHREAIRSAIHKKTTADHNRFIGGIYRLTGHSVKSIIGEDYKFLKKTVDNAYGYRRKLLHGQQTDQSLTREHLLDIQSSLYRWCKLLAQGGHETFGYDGFGRNSLRKTNRPEITKLVDGAINSKGWEQFVFSL